MRGDRASKAGKRLIAFSSNKHAIRWRASKTGRYRRDIWFSSTFHALIDKLANHCSSPAGRRRGVQFLGDRFIARDTANVSPEVASRCPLGVIATNVNPP
jgi:hypothetical protein